MSAENPRETFRRLFAIANNDAATDAERENARRVMDRYTAKYGDEVSIPEAEAQIEGRVEFANVYEDRLATHCAIFAGCKSFMTGKRKYVGTKRERFVSDGKTTLYRGSETAVLAAVELYKHHSAKMAELLEVTENAYRFGAMPLPPSDEPKTSAPVPEHLLAALRAASRVGRTHSLTNTLPAKTGT